MVMTVSWCKGVNLWSFARCQHRGVLAEDFERTRVILRGDDEGLLAHVGPDFQCGFNRNARLNLESLALCCSPPSRSRPPVAIPKAAKLISRFMTVLPQSAGTVQSRCIRGMSPVMELVSFVSRWPEGVA